MLDKAQQTKERILELQTILELEEADLRKVSDINREALSVNTHFTLRLIDYLLYCRNIQKKR